MAKANVVQFCWLRAVFENLDTYLFINVFFANSNNIVTICPTTELVAATTNA